MASANYIRYFMYSYDQYLLQKSVEEGRGSKKFILPSVVFKGKKHQYTDIVSDPNKSRFADAVVVAQGDIREMKYNLK